MSKKLITTITLISMILTSICSCNNQQESAETTTRRPGPIESDLPADAEPVFGTAGTKSSQNYDTTQPVGYYDPYLYGETTSSPYGENEITDEYGQYIQTAVKIEEQTTQTYIYTGVYIEGSTTTVPRPPMTTPITSTFVTEMTPCEDPFPIGVYALFINGALKYFYVFNTDVSGKCYDAWNYEERSFTYEINQSMEIDFDDGETIIIENMVLDADTIFGFTSKQTDLYMFRYRPDGDIYSFSMDNLPPSCAYDYH